MISSYSTALDLLDNYDHQRLKLSKTENVEFVKINDEEARNAINELGKLRNLKAYSERKKMILLKDHWKIFIKLLTEKSYTKPLNKKRHTYFILRLKSFFH